MNINTNNYSVSTKANAAPVIKKFSYALENGEKLACRHNDNLMEVMISKPLKNGKEAFVNGICEFNSKGLKGSQLEHILKQITDGLNDGKRFLLELIKSQRA